MADLSRGHLLPRLEEIMDFLSEYHPPLRFPADDGRKEAEVLSGWQRGGTSPSGEDLGDVATATWYVGDKYLKSSLGAPQRIVWLPPEFGQERFTFPDSAGDHAERDQVGGGEEHLGTRAFRRVLSRVVPVIADVWANDYDDLDILIHWLASAVFCTNAGAPEGVGEKPIESGGYVPDQMIQRGVRYQLTCNLVFPIAAPYHELMKARSASVAARTESEEHRSLRLRAQAAKDAPLRARGARFPADLDTTPWRRTTFADPAAGPVLPDDPGDPED